MERLRATPPTELGGLAVESVEDLSIGSEALPPTDGLRYQLADGARVIVRPSGPETNITCYLEVFVPAEDLPTGEGVRPALQLGRFMGAGPADAMTLGLNPPRGLLRNHNH